METFLEKIGLRSRLISATNSEFFWNAEGTFSNIDYSLCEQRLRQEQLESLSFLSKALRAGQ